MAYHENEGMAPEEQQVGGDNSFYLPADFPDSASLSTGDTITLRVVSIDESGEIEVEPVGGGGTDWKKDLRKSMAEETPTPPEE